MHLCVWWWCGGGDVFVCACVCACVRVVEAWCVVEKVVGDRYKTGQWDLEKRDHLRSQKLKNKIKNKDKITN